MNKLTGIFSHVRKLAYIMLIPAICYLPAYLVIKDSFSQQQSTLKNQVSDLEIKVSKLERKIPKPPLNKETEELQKDLDKTEKENLRSSLSSDLFKDLAFPVLFAIASIFAAFAVKDILTKILEDKDREKLAERIVVDITPQMKKILENLVQDELDRSIDPRLGWLEYEIAIIGKHFSIIYGDDNDKKNELIDKYKGEKLVAECELKIAISQLIANSDLVQKSDLLTQVWTYGTPTSQQCKNNSKSTKDLIDKYLSGNLDVKIKKLNLMSRELKESKLLENELMTEIDKKIRELGDKLASQGAEVRGADRASQLGEGMSMNPSVPSGK